MKKTRMTLIVFAAIIIAVQVFHVNYSDLSWGVNAAAYIGICSMVLVIIAMVASNRHDKKNQAND
ncbi:hypothetical protein [Carboxylicivirga taeanensis]|uniref:hypothetical protein n=1 Tax=Carboxylicivirga taeanensis TaxID=1416875 RepID=UPI003F6DB9A8